VQDLAEVYYIASHPTGRRYSAIVCVNYQESAVTLVPSHRHHTLTITHLINLCDQCHPA